jgi:hypothetical protein
VVEAVFDRNDSFDRVLGPKPVDRRGLVAMETSAMTVADAVVRHPMVARVPVAGAWPKVPPVKNRKAEVVEREELIRIVLELAAGDGDGRAQLTDDAREALQRLLALNEVSSAADTLAAIRRASQALEDTHPHLALRVRHAQAIARAAQNAFVGKINFWFDAAMARATQQYTARARAITVVGALVVAVVLQFNSIDLLQRLSTDNTFRSSLVEMARIEQERIDKLQSTPGAAQDELELHKARRQEIDANLAALRAPELAILPDHLLWQAVPRARLMRDPLWQGPYPARLQLVAGGKTWDVQPSWRNDYMQDIHAAIEASGAPVTGVMLSGDEYLVLKAETPFVARVFGSDPSATDRSATRLRELAAEGLGAVVETELRLTSEWPQDGSALGAMQLLIDSKPTAVPLTQDGKPLTVVRATLLDHLRDRLALAAPALRVRVRCERNGRAAGCADASDPDVVRVLVVTARHPEIRDIRLLSDPVNPYSNRLGTLQRRPLAYRVRASDLPAASPANLRVYIYQDEADAPATVAGDRRFVQVQLDAGPASPNGSPALAARTSEPANAAAASGAPPPAATAVDDPAARTEDRIAFVELPRTAPSRNGRTPTAAERAAAALREQFRRPLAGSEAAPAWPPTLTADSYTNDELVLTADRLGTLELRHSPGKPETNVLSRPVERVRPWTEWSQPASPAGIVDAASNAFGPGVFGVLLSWALLSLGAPFWFDALKNALKLRPSAAVTEEKNSRERQSHSPPPATRPAQ